MGTVVNGNIWSGACVAGKEITGLVKNGVVFYKREIPTPSVYKRRIMVGDNLKGLQIFLEQYPDDFYNDLWESDGQGTTTIIEYNDGNYNAYVYNNATFNPPNDFILNHGNIDLEIVTDWGTSIYSFDLTTEPISVTVNSPQQVESDTDYIVTTVKDTSSGYRCLFIEDPNIRPVQVGDIITKNTKFYFNVPDDFYLQEPPPGVNGKDVDVIVLNNDLHYFVLRSRDDEIYTAFYLDTMRSEEGNMYEYNRETSTLIKNISMIVGPHRTYQNMHFEGTVTSVATDSTIYPYILVDTTTLGA